MPPKKKITEEMLLNEAFHIAREQGIEAVTSRSVAKAVGCSIQPVFSHFATMEELRKATFRYASEKMMREVLQYQDEPDFMEKTCCFFLNLARKESNLFHALYLSNNYSHTNLWEVMWGWEINKKMLANLASKDGISEEDCKDIFMRGFYLLYGITTMIATKQMELSDEEVIRMVKCTTREMLKGLLEKKDV